MSDKIKHTQGPWVITEGDVLSNFIYDNEGEDGLLYPIATIEHADPEILAANTALIAAAPELLEALNEINALLSEHPEASQGNSRVHYCMHKARSAIINAIG